MAAAVAGFAVMGFVGTTSARADDTASYQLAGLVDTGEIFVTGGPSYDGVWHHVTPSELVSIMQTGPGWDDITWYAGDDDALPGACEDDLGISEENEGTASDHQLAGLMETGDVYVTGEPGYADGVWTHVTPAELASIERSGSGDITWYDELPGSVASDESE